MQDVITLCRESSSLGYSDKVIDILLKYSPVILPAGTDIILLMREFGQTHWKDVCDFVRDDECV